MSKSGPVLRVLEKDTENRWSVPADSSSTDAQYANFKAGELYVNAHSTTNAGGGDLRPCSARMACP